MDFQISFSRKCQFIYFFKLACYWSKAKLIVWIDFVWFSSPLITVFDN